MAETRRMADAGGTLALPIVGVLLLLITFCPAAFAGAPITVVVLPPVRSAVSGDMVAPAELFCDQLAAELAREAELRVVDRTQIDRVLAERAIDGVTRPALAYDALLRVSIDSLRAQPAVILRIVDLSTGNVAGSHEWPWTAEVSSDRLREMANACKKSLIKAISASQGRVKVRLLEVATPSGMDRLETMRDHLEQMIQQVVARCPKVCVVQHQEALTAKEESLLLLLGHVRLAGGRRFVAHADRVLAVELAEAHARGKAFPQTIIEIRFRLSKGGQDSDWMRVRGSVADWSTLAPQACQLLAAQLGQANPETVAQYVTEMIVRRRQAEAELQAAMPPYGSGREPDFQRVAAAAKLDPTYEEAAYELLCACEFENTYREDGIADAIRYLERFPQREYRSHRHSVMTKLTQIYNIDEPAKDSQQIATLRKIVDIGFGDDIQCFHTNCAFVIESIYRGWRALGVDSAGCQQWLEQIRARTNAFAAETPYVQVCGESRFDIERSLLRVRGLLVTAAQDSGNADLARQRLKEFMTYGRVVTRDKGFIARNLRETVVRMADPALLAKYDHWLAERTTPVEEIKLTWDDYPVYDGVRTFERAEKLPPMLPLVATPGAVYGVKGAFVSEGGLRELRRKGHPDPQTILRIPVNNEGQPTGDPVPLALPALNSNLAVSGATFHGGVLCVSTEHTGLLSYNVAANKWKQITPSQGLPDWYVDYVCPLDEKTILVVAGDPNAGRVSFSSYNAETNQITLLSRLDGRSSKLIAPLGVWRQGHQLLGITYIGLVQDMLRVPRLNMYWPGVQPYGWPCPANRLTSMAVVGDKRFVLSYQGLHEIDDNGMVVRSWWSRTSLRAGSRDPSVLARDFITTPGDFPTDKLHPTPDYGSEHNVIVASGNHLFLVSPEDGILCYEPTSDTWFGPLSLADEFSIEWPLGTANGLWIGGQQGTAYIRTVDFIAAAKAAGRVMTTADVHRRKAELAEGAGPLAAAKFHLLLRDFGGAMRRVETVLASNPADPQALLLMAVLHDFWCLNRPDEAIEWYRKLAALKADRSAVCTGLYAVFRINYALGRWDQTILAGEHLLDEIPCLSERAGAAGGGVQVVEQFIEHARQQRDKVAGTASERTQAAPAAEPQGSAAPPSDHSPKGTRQDAARASHSKATPARRGE